MTYKEEKNIRLTKYYTNNRKGDEKMRERRTVSLSGSLLFPDGWGLQMQEEYKKEEKVSRMKPEQELKHTK